MEPVNEDKTLKRAVSYDCHGFIVDEESQPEPPQEGSDSSLIQSWTSVCERWHHVQNKSPIKVRNLLKKGLPTEVRSRVWKLFLNSEAPKQQSQFNYQSNVKALMVMLEDYGISEEAGYANLKELNKTIALGEQNDSVTSVVYLRQILMDIDRTFPEHQLFTSDGPGRSSLLHVLAVYTQYNPTVGYCQGMSYVAAMLLMYLDEEDAFWAVVSLFEAPKYLANFYDSEFSKLQRFADVFAMLLKDRQCQLATHLEHLGLHPLMYTVPWFLCLFTFLPCWDTVLLICDLLLLEGVTALLKAGLALMEQLSNELQAMDGLGEVIHFIQNPPERLVCRSQMVSVLWRRSNHVDKQEMDALFDVAISQSDVRPAKNTTRSSRKRSREDDDKSTQGSFFSRMIETPAKKLRELTSSSTSKWTSSRRGTKSTRKIPAQSLSNGMSPSAIEMIPMDSVTSVLDKSDEYSAVWQKLSNRSSPIVFNSQHGQPELRQVCNSVPVRRSSRLRRSMRSPNVFNVPTMKGPITSHPEERLAFRTFNTPAPLRMHQETGVSSGALNDQIVSPEVELKDIHSKSNSSPLQRALFTDE